MVPETKEEMREERKEQRRERRERHRGEKWSIRVIVCVSRVPGDAFWMLFWVRGACHYKNTANLEFDDPLTRFATF